jgi:hypothetical protein
VRRKLQSLYNRAGAATVKRKSFADAEAIRAWLDTPDCVYTLAGQPPRTWAEMRSIVEAELLTPCDEASSKIQTIELHGDQATIEAAVHRTAAIVDHAGQFGPCGETWTVMTNAHVRDSWTRTPSGWRRQSHEKIRPDRTYAFMGIGRGF